MQTLVNNRERVDAYLLQHFPQRVARKWRRLGDPATPGRDGCYIVLLGRFSDPDDPGVAVTGTKGWSEDFTTAICAAAVAAEGIEGVWGDERP